MKEYLWDVIKGYFAILYSKESQHFIPRLEFARAPVPEHFDPRDFYESIPREVDFPRRLQRGRNG